MMRMTTTRNATAEQRQFIERLKQTEVNRSQRGQDFYCLELLSKQESPDMDSRDMSVLAHYFGGPVDYFVLDFDAQTGIGWGFVSLGNPDYAEYGPFYMKDVETMRVGFGAVLERNRHWKPVTIRELKESPIYSPVLKNA